MGGRACAVALWCALAVAGAAAYTVDCNHEYTDCDTELSKMGTEDDEIPSSTSSSASVIASSTSAPFLPTIPTSHIATTEKKDSPQVEVTTRAPGHAEVSETETPEGEPVAETTESSVPKQGRLLNLNVDELQNFANALHNDTSKRMKGPKVDLSDVNMDEEEDDTPRLIPHDHGKHNKPTIPDKFYTNLQVPFQGLLGLADTRASEEQDTCKENEVPYKIGDRIDRGCEESCECQPGGNFECNPRCKHPYIRRGRRITDPLCFESPVDECCSIVACATGNQEVKANKVDVCRFNNNETHTVGEKWNIGCEQTCSCEANSVITCKPRCKKLIQSDKCINVQDPNDECCEVQVCDVSQDVHEEPVENTTSSTTSTTSTTTTTMSTSITEEGIKGFEDYSDLLSHRDDTVRPLNFLPTLPSSIFPSSEETMHILSTASNEPIGYVKVLQNNSVQVNLMHMNTSEKPIYLMLSSDGGKTFEDVELKYSNLILNLPGGKDYILKSKETGTKFNFTITATGVKGENDTVSIKEGDPGCYEDGKFYAVGEEFHIGCSELCECTGHNTRECVELVCPSHVGLELVSKGCVRWAPSPPAKPPNCCPRTARCLSDGTCHYKGIAVPNWSEVPISITGCEQRCFCENGELECQEACTPLPPVPPQSLRCPPLHHPMPVNISDEDCCKRWGCVPNAEEVNSTASTLPTYEVVPIFPSGTYVAPVAPVPSVTSSTLPPLTPVKSTSTTDFYKHLHPVKSFPKVLKSTVISNNNEPQKYSIEIPGDNQEADNITVFTLDDFDSPLIKSIQADRLMSSLDLRGRPKVPDILSEFKSPTHDGTKYKSKHPDINDPENMLSEFDRHSGPKKPLYQYSTTKGSSHSPHAKTGTFKMHTPQPTFFIPASAPGNGAQTQTDVRIISLNPQSLFVPTVNENRSFVHHTSRVIQSSHKLKSLNKAYKHVSYGHKPDVSHLNPRLNTKMDNRNTAHRQLTQDSNSHVLYKAPNPYESVLLRPVKLTKTSKTARVQSPLGLDQIVSQLEVASDVNRNLGRSADDNEARDTAAGQTPPPPLSDPSHPQAPFLPTVPPVSPPDIHFPNDEIPDYDQNNLHKPVRDPTMAGLPPGFTIPPNYGEENKKLTVLSLQADSPTSVKLLFGLPPVLVGLRGSVDLRYTDKLDQDVSQWYSQVFAPADEVLTTPRLEFRLTGLKPSTTYKIKGKLFLHNLPVEPESQVYSIRTMDLPSVMPDEGKRREIDSRLTVIDVNDTAAHVSWRHFTEDELQFVDGIQVRYRPVGTPIYSMTELLHHSRSIAELHDLRPGTRYEASLIIVPPPRATTELHDPGRVEFTTNPFVDPYNWTVTIDVKVVGADAAELTWHGVPSPAERWVRVYRAAHACGATRHEHDAFRLAARDLPPTIVLNGLEPSTRCRVWLELFLTNGKIKTSNVLEIKTKSEDSPEDIDNEIEALTAGSRGDGRGDYYGALVVVGVVAALGALTSLLLLLVLVRRHRPRSVPITREYLTAGSRGDGRGDYYGALVVVGVVAALGALTSLLLLLVLVRRHRPRSVPITREYLTAGSRGDGRGDYYGALVVVGVVAALGALTSLLLLLVLVRRHRPRSVPITREYLTAGSRGDGRGDYYGALVVVGVVAALGALTSLLLLLVLVRRHRPRSVPITREYLTAGSRGDGRGDYYGALVVVGVVAALGALTSLLLLLVLVRRHRPRSVPITREYLTAGSRGDGRGDYYGALVVVGVVAALGALTSLLLLLVLVRRHRPRSVPITREYLTAGSRGDGRGDYYGALVVVGVVAALGALTSLLLLLVLVRRHRPRSVPITREYLTAGSRGDGRGDYYGALVVVGVVAALGALTSLLLLLVLVRRHRPRSVPITREYLTAGSRGDGRGDYYGALVVVGVVAALGALTSLLLLLVLVRRHRPRSVPITREYLTAGSRGDGRGDYYGALVVVGVVAALGAWTSLLLLLVLVRRHRPRSVPITPVPTAPRESSLPPYDNPAYKLELQQETMDL